MIEPGSFNARSCVSFNSSLFGVCIGPHNHVISCACQGMPRKWKPSFYAYQTADSLFISWPDSIASEENRKRELARKAKADHAAADNPFIRLHRKKCGDRIFKALTRFAEMAHYELISERANLRYQGDGDGSYKCYTWGVGMHGRLGHGYGVAYATPQMLPHHEGTRIQIMRVSCGAQHSIACTYDGSVLTWGNGQYGQLGDGQHPQDYQGVGFNIAYSPKPVSHLKRYFIIGVAAGRWHNLAMVQSALPPLSLYRPWHFVPFIEGLYRIR